MHITAGRDSRFEYSQLDNWPTLAWLAACRKGGVISVYHGSGVETRDDWFCEAAWDGNFELGDFDETDLVVGSGARNRRAHVTFVSSGATVDRLHHMEYGGLTFVSNSLPCLLSATDASLIPNYSAYCKDIASIANGLSNYHRRIPTTRGYVTFTYFDNLQWKTGKLLRVPKPEDRVRNRSFAAYRNFLHETLSAFLNNGVSSARATTFRPLSTLSSGYDSATVASLARELGAKEVLCFDRARGSFGDDSGLPIAEHLGLDAAIVSSTRWKQLDCPELPFIIGDSNGGEVVYAGAEDHLRGRLLLTGYHGDHMWGMDTKSLGGEIVRATQSGLGLSEYRLFAGFLNCAIPFWNVRRIRDINQVSNSPELKPWVLPGTSYNRPICRRIVEDAGVPRNKFGIQKKPGGLLLGRQEPLSEAASSDHLAWMRDNQTDWIRNFKVPPLRSLRFDALRARARMRPELFARKSERYLQRRLPQISGIVDWIGPSRLVRLVTGAPEFASTLHRYRFAWACERWKAHYPGAHTVTTIKGSPQG